MADLKKDHNFEFKIFYSFDEIKSLCKRKKIKPEVKEHEVQPGWIYSAKGLLQVLYERKMIDKEFLSEYSNSGKITQMNDKGIILDEYKNYFLRPMMEQCSY